MIKCLEPQYVIKSRATTAAHIKTIYLSGVTRLKSELSNVNFVAFTTDMWTSMQNIAFMCMTAQWVTPDWRLASAILQTREVGERHTGENISIRLADAANEWGIADERIAATVHDNGSNVNLAMNLLDTWPDQRCFAHTLQLAINAGLSVRAIEKMLGAARRLAAHFKRSTVSSEALRQKRAALGGLRNKPTVGEAIVEDCKILRNNN